MYSWSSLREDGCELRLILVLMASFQDDLGKAVPECQTILGFITATGSDGGSRTASHMQIVYT